MRQSADAIIHFPPNTNVDGSPSDYPRVRAVVRSGVGFDALDLAGWGRRGVAVFNVPDYGTSEVADHAIALMLALARGTAAYHDALRADCRDRRVPPARVGGMKPFFACVPHHRRVVRAGCAPGADRSTGSVDS